MASRHRRRPLLAIDGSAPARLSRPARWRLPRRDPGRAEAAPGQTSRPRSENDAVKTGPLRIGLRTRQVRRLVLGPLLALNFDAGYQQSRRNRRYRNAAGFGAANPVEYFALVRGGKDVAETRQWR